MLLMVVCLSCLSWLVASWFCKDFFFAQRYYFLSENAVFIRIYLIYLPIYLNF